MQTVVGTGNRKTICKGINKTESGQRNIILFIGQGRTYYVCVAQVLFEILTKYQSEIRIVV